MKRSDKIVSAIGGQLLAMSAEGEHLFSVAVPSGIVEAWSYFDLLPEGAGFEPSGELVLIGTEGKAFGRVVAPMRDQTGANPDYVPSSIADQMHRQMLLRVDSMARAYDRLERRALQAEAGAMPRGAAKESSTEREPVLVEPVAAPVVADAK